MKEAKIIITLDNSYGDLNKQEYNYTLQKYVDKEYDIDDLLGEIERLLEENEEYQNEIDELKEEIKELNNRIRDYEEKENENE